jgi:hypothetical protein
MLVKRSSLCASGGQGSTGEYENVDGGRGSHFSLRSFLATLPFILLPPLPQGGGDNEKDYGY